MKTSDTKQFTSEEFITKSLIKLLADKELSSIDIAQICRKAGVSRITFYRFFPSKEEVIARYFGKVMSAFLERAPKVGKQKDLLLFLETYFSFLQNQGDALRVILKANAGFLLLNYLDDLVRVFMKKAFPSSSESDLSMLTGALYNNSIFFLTKNVGDSPKKAAQSFYDFCFVR